MNFRVASSILLSLGLSFSVSAGAQESTVSELPTSKQTLAGVIERYPSGTINSTELADQALEDVRRQRAELDAQFARDEAVCYEKFFVTACMDAAKERRRKAVKQLQAIEVEANAYHRRAKVEQRDQVLRERQAKQEAEASDRTNVQAGPDKAGAPASSTDIANTERRARQASSAPSAAPTKHYNTERAAEHAQELAAEKEKERAEAQKRAENVKAYEKKQQRSLERQREIAEQKKAKEGERAAGKAQ